MIFFLSNIHNDNFSLLIVSQNEQKVKWRLEQLLPGALKIINFNEVGFGNLKDIGTKWDSYDIFRLTKISFSL
jgi:hypothetical protein